MLDWVTGIWHKPLATLTLLDILGLSILFVALWIGWLVVSMTLSTAKISREQNKAKNAPDYMDKM